MPKELKITDIRVGHRHRKDMGNLTSLANSIRQDGFQPDAGGLLINSLHPIFPTILRSEFICLVIHPCTGCV
jgi:hypothetical protein